MQIAPVTMPARRFARLAAYRFFGGPIHSVYKRRDCAREIGFFQEASYHSGAQFMSWPCQVSAR